MSWLDKALLTKWKIWSKIIFMWNLKDLPIKTKCDVRIIEIDVVERGSQSKVFCLSCLLLLQDVYMRTNKLTNWV